MVTPTNHVIAGPDLHRTEPLAIWGFSMIFLPNIGEEKKVSPFECEALALCHRINPALVVALRL